MNTTKTNRKMPERTSGKDLIKKTAAAVTMFIITCAVTACGSKPVPVPADELCSDQWDGKNVITDGTVMLKNTKLTNGRYPIHLSTDRKKRTLLVSIKKGIDFNTMKALPSRYGHTDLSITADDGSIIKHGDKIKVTGKMTDTSKTNCCLQVEKIEKHTGDNETI